MTCWLKRRRRASEGKRALEEAERGFADAERKYLDTLRLHARAFEVGETATQQRERNHFAQAIDEVYRGRR